MNIGGGSSSHLGSLGQLIDLSNTLWCIVTVIAFVLLLGCVSIAQLCKVL